MRLYPYQVPLPKGLRAAGGALAAALAAALALAACGGAAAPASTPAASGAAASPATSASAATSAKPAASTAASAAASASASAAIKPAAAGAILVSYSELSASNQQAYVAQEQGIFQKNGLNVDLRLIPSTTGVPALIAGETNIAQLGGSEALAAAVGGADLVITASLAPVFPYTFVVAPSIKTKADLIGKKVGVSQIGSSSDVALRTGLKKYGVTPDKDVTVLAVGSRASQTAAASNGAVQGELTHPPDSLDLEKLGWHELFDLASLGLPSANTTVVASRSWLNGHKDVMQKYIDSVVTAEALAKKDKTGTEAVLKKYLKVDDQQALDETYDFYTNKVLAVLPYPKADQLSDAIEQLGEKNANAKSFNVGKILDDSFVKSAADRGLDKA